ncbi:hypothetical protein [Rhizobium leguminosarum]|uniref:hypothetical protein n=1 Tax=Rhizobium leguminosarum TaxID=384 RepID=UPI001C95C141|nr:hypothetical protein [Rhizobium leguminosarum]MBY5660132.1 hypothetical protein [Rhizobium leguminosarum]MBY5673755.1 hypothetical protein [Rhizobium leguminosarum]
MSGGKWLMFVRRQLGGIADAINTVTTEDRKFRRSNSQLGFLEPVRRRWRINRAS